jgi:hypothetical protein
VLVVALLLDLPVAAVFLEAKMLKFLSPLLTERQITVHLLASVYSVHLPHPAVVVVSGSVQFFSGLKGRLSHYSHVLWILQQSFRGLSFKSWLRTLTIGTKRCKDWGLSPVRFCHDSYGGATTACHLFGFSPAFGIDASTYHHPPNVERSIKHFWKPAANAPVKFCSSLAEVVGDPRRPVITKGILRAEGLLPIQSPLMEICGPSVFHPGKQVRRRLTKEEYMAIFDVPSVLFSTFAELGYWALRSSFGTVFRLYSKSDNCSRNTVLA